MGLLGFFNRILFAVNLLFAGLLLIACFVPYISVASFPYFSILSLTVPLLVLINLVFAGYWMFLWQRRLWWSVGVLALGYFSMGTFFKMGGTSVPVDPEDIQVMSFNTRSFDRSDLMGDPTIGQQIVDLVRTEDPDIVCFQEFDYRRRKGTDFAAYPYHYVNFRPKSQQVVQAIYSKFPIIESGSLDFPDSANNGVFADVVIARDTIRVYNLHLQSHSVIPSVRQISRRPKGKLMEKLSGSFAKQQAQAAQFDTHRRANTYKKIICGDLNNTQYSNVYHVVKGDMKDTFLEQGTGYGRTYNFKYYPLRIDFIFGDPSFEVTSHKNYSVALSDHFPVMASFKLRP